MLRAVSLFIISVALFASVIPAEAQNKPGLQVKVRTWNRKPLVDMEGQSIQTMGYSLRGPRSLLRKVRGVEWSWPSGRRLGWGSSRQAFGGQFLATTGATARLEAKVFLRDGSVIKLQGSGRAASNKYDAEAMRKHKFGQSLRKLKALNRRSPSPQMGQVIEMLERLPQ